MTKKKNPNIKKYSTSSLYDLQTSALLFLQLVKVQTLSTSGTDCPRITREV